MAMSLKRKFEPLNVCCCLLAETLEAVNTYAVQKSEIDEITDLLDMEVPIENMNEELLVSNGRFQHAMKGGKQHGVF